MLHQPVNSDCAACDGGRELCTVYALLTPSDTRPVKQFIKPTNCPVVGMHFIFIRTHPTHQPMLYSLYSLYSWHCYTVSSWVVVVQAVNLTVKLFTGSPHATRLLWSEYKKPGQHRSVVTSTRYWPMSAVQQGSWVFFRRQKLKYLLIIVNEYCCMQCSVVVAVSTQQCAAVAV